MTNFGTVSVGRVTDDEMKTIPYDNGQTVRDILDKAGLDLADSESVKLNDGTVVDLDVRVTDGERYFVSTQMKAGM